MMIRREASGCLTQGNGNCRAGDSGAKVVEKFYVRLIQGRGKVSWRRVRQKGLEPCGSSTLLNPFPPFPSDTPCTRRKGGKVRTPLRGSVQAGTIPGNAPFHGNVCTPQRGSVQPLSGCAPMARMVHEGSLVRLLGLGNDGETGGVLE